MGAALSFKQFSLVTWVISFAHYTLGFIYSQKRIKDFVQTSRGKWIFGITLASCVLMVLSDWPAISLYFGVHHALTQVFVTPEMRRDHLIIAATRMIFHTTLAIFIVLGGSSVWLPLVSTMLIANLFIIVGLRVYMRSYDNSSLVFDAAHLLAIPFLVGATVQPVHLIFFHVVFWFFVPMIQERSAESRFNAKSYFQWNAVLIPAFSVLVLVMANYGHSSQWWVWTIGYFHITASFLFSDFNFRFRFKRSA